MKKNFDPWKWLLLVFFVMFAWQLAWPPTDTQNDKGELVPGKIPLGTDIIGGTEFLYELVHSDIGKIVRQQLEEESKADSLRTGKVYVEPSDDAVQDGVEKRLASDRDTIMEIVLNRIDATGIANARVYAQGKDRIVVELAAVTDEQRERIITIIDRVAQLTFQLVHKESNEAVSKIFVTQEAPPGYAYKEEKLGERVYRGYVETNELGRAEWTPDQMSKWQAAVRRWGNAPSGAELYLQRENYGISKSIYVPYFVESRIQLRGDLVKSASMSFDEMQGNVVLMGFNGEGAKKFAKVTRNYAPNGPMNEGNANGRLLAVIMDGRLFSAPELQEAITGGEARITGTFTPEEARDLASVLRSGSLPARIIPIQRSQISATLGADSIHKATRAIMYSGIAVLGFMLIYYMTCGLVANIALILNMILLPVGLFLVAGFMGMGADQSHSATSAMLLPVLTLPGIAGILLTIGMAVDANVLIFERMREEFKMGKKVWPAIMGGYDRAFVTILDANLTTFITGIILYAFGSGPIRGFAITLCGGILVSMYTALFVTRMIFQLFAQNAKPGTIRMLTVVKDSVSIDFVGKRGIAAVLSVVLIGGSWFLMFQKDFLGVDFTGGIAVTHAYASDTVPESEKVVAAYTEAGFPGTQVQVTKEIGSEGKYVKVTVPVDTDASAPKPDAVEGEESANVESDDRIHEVSSILLAGFGSDYEISEKPASINMIGGVVGNEMRAKAVTAVIWALIAIIAYITFRFKFGFALGAIVALIHDVLLTVGIFAVLGRQLDLTIVAALLTIVGYSVNDTIVVFDRIREDLKKSENRTKGFPEIANESINRTLSRTLLTSMTTLIVIGILLIWGGNAINSFALALCIGVLVGTYSSVFVATPVILWWHRDKKPDMG